MARPKLTLFVDVVSPFAYMAWYILRNSPTFRPCEVTFIPIFLGAVMQTTGNRAPLEIKNKAQWIARERDRWCKRFSIPICEKGPQPFPQSTLVAQRALCFIQQEQPEKFDECLAALYEAFWIERKMIKDPAVVQAALATVLGEARAKEALEATGKPEVKKLLQKNTDVALQEGAFGLPYFVATNSEGVKEAFWGFDHLGAVVDFLGLQRDHTGFRAML